MEATENDLRPSGGRGLALTVTLFAIALVLRLYHVHELRGGAFEDMRPLISDSAYYDLRAKQIAGGQVVPDAPGFLSPGYCWFLGACYALIGTEEHGAKLVQALLGALSVALVHRAGRRLFGEASGALAALGLAAYGELVYYTAVLLPTTLVLFLHAVLLWVLARRPPTRASTLVAGLVIGLAIGTKANALLLLPALAAWLFVGFREVPAARRAAWVLLMCLGAGATVAPVTWLNARASDGSFVLVTTTGGRNLLKGNGDNATGTHRMLTKQTTHIRFYLDGDVDVARAVEEDRELSSEAWAYMAEHPLRTAGLWVTKLRLLFNRIDLGIRDSYTFMRTQSFLGGPVLGFAVLAPLGLAGLLLHGLKGRRAWLVTSVFATQVASFVLIFVLNRYRVVLVACLALFAGQLLVGLVRAARNGRWKHVAAAVLLTALGALFVHDDIDGFEEIGPPAEQYHYLADWQFAQGDLEAALVTYDLAATGEWRLFRATSLWDVRERIGDCHLALGRPGLAVKIWMVLAAEIEATLPDRVVPRKARLADKILAVEGAQRGPRGQRE